MSPIENATLIATYARFARPTQQVSFVDTEQFNQVNDRQTRDHRALTTLVRECWIHRHAASDARRKIISAAHKTLNAPLGEFDNRQPTHPERLIQEQLTDYANHMVETDETKRNLIQERMNTRINVLEDGSRQDKEIFQCFTDSRLIFGEFVRELAATSTPGPATR
jgi:hypothetical protein